TTEGTMNSHVQKIQRALLAKGYDLNPWGADGDLGPITEKAILEAIARSPDAQTAEKPKSYRDMTRVEFEAPVRPVMAHPLPALWLPDARMERIIWHWTAGSYNASETDKEHYHFLIEGDGDIVRGEYSVKDNEVIRGSGTYAAHTLSCN